MSSPQRNVRVDPVLDIRDHGVLVEGVERVFEERKIPQRSRREITVG
jgi:hypothetical protein